MRLYVVRNRNTGIVVSDWDTKDEAEADKAMRDAKYADFEPPEQSCLEVVVQP